MDQRKNVVSFDVMLLFEHGDIMKLTPSITTTISILK